MFAWRRRPFAEDGRPLETTSEHDDRLWRRRVAEAAGLAADDVTGEDDPHLRALYSDLRALEARMSEDDDQTPDGSDPRHQAG